MSRSPAVSLAIAVIFVAALGCAQEPPRIPPPADGPDDAGLLDAGRDAGRDAGHDAAQPRDSGLGAEAFAMRPRETDLVMAAGSSRMLEIELVRAEGFEVPIVIAGFGLPPGIVMHGTIAEADDMVVFVILEADGGAVTQRPIPFSLQASAAGWQRRARITLTVTP